MDALLANRNNNFNLIRLLACLQVMVLHTYNLYDVGENTLFLDVLWLFPGVIIFFSISGFLIAKSFDYSSPNSFCRKRILRIFPALTVNVFVTCLLLLYLGYATLNSDLLKFVLAQLTIFQFYTPESLKGFAQGHHPNGALWTISVELQFYALYFAFARLLSWKKRDLFFKNSLVVVLIILSCTINYLANRFLDGSTITYKLIFNSVFYNFSFFGVGILFYLNFSRAKKLFANTFSIWATALVAIICMIVYTNTSISRYSYNHLSFAYLLLLIFTVFSLAFSFKNLSNNILGKIDISYGTYIYHVVIIHVFYNSGVSPNYFLLIYAASILCGTLSWFGIEQYFLRKKDKLPPISWKAISPNKK
ncbi:hypothetical protein BCY91_14200 [Pelobium manganitolerans]|uniref:Acyltransferase 3 domain-containing protein n=1 Tax=Pelobium manganitolerans TaxID=1842495 RepID=A0A419SAE3_9SPHI|nr:acyltransferase [Pelobium manganitolerans]RKD19024.1 hypothetical protein BCY91_14200 [Pelobium manganitolerans]